MTTVEYFSSQSHDRVYRNIRAVISRFIRDRHEFDMALAIHGLSQVMVYRTTCHPEFTAVFDVALRLADRAPYDSHASDRLAELTLALIAGHDARVCELELNSINRSRHHMPAGWWHFMVRRALPSTSPDGQLNREAFILKVERGLNAVGRTYLPGTHRFVMAVESGPAPDTFLMMAALTILHHGRAIYRQARLFNHDPDAPRCARNCTKTVDQPGIWTRLAFSSDPHAKYPSVQRTVWTRLCMNRWRFWRYAFMDAAMGRMEWTGQVRRGARCRELALQAVGEMIEIEDEDELKGY